MLPVHDVTKFSLLDYPGKVSALIWFSGCNYRCSYCYNSSFAFEEHKNIDTVDIINFLKSRKEYLQAVVLTGGECTLYDNLFNFAKQIKELGFLVKVDTNGSNPGLLKKMLDHNLIDYVAIDLKAPKSKYIQVTKCDKYDDMMDSIRLLLNSNIQYEIRTTLIPGFIDRDEVAQMMNILETIEYKGVYYIQNLRKCDGCPINSYSLKNKIEECVTNNNYSFKVNYRKFD